MAESRSFGEDELSAWLDGELDEAARAEIEVALAGDPEATATVAAWRAQGEALHAAFDSVLDEPVPPALAAAASAPAPKGRTGSGMAGWMRAAAALALFVAGAGAGWVANDRLGPPAATIVNSENRFIHQAVSAHVVFIRERRHAVEVDAAKEEAHLVRWLSARLGRKFRPPALTQGGFALYGGRLVADEGGPAAQYMYQNGAKQRVTLYVRKRRDVPETAFRFAEERGQAAFYWIDGPLAYAIVAPLPRERMLQLARLVFEQTRDIAKPDKPRS
jgi:anti-sigma factor RsiW